MIKEVTELLSGYQNNEIEIVDGLNFNQYQTLRTIEFYHNSKYLFGQYDELGREKPFYNINRFRLNVAVRATDFDTKDFILEPDREGDSTRVMLLREAFKDWTREVNFAKTLNEATYSRAKYGGVLLKKEKSNPLQIDVVDWRNVIMDPIDGVDGTMIEIHYMTPAKLKKKGWYTDEVKQLLTTERKNAIGDSSKSSSKAVRTLEIYGEFEEDDYELHKYIWIEGTEEPVFKEKVKEKPYKYIAWEVMPGRALGWGVLEDGFEAQVWTNDAVLKERDLVDHASKIFYKTNDESIEDNVLTGLDNGHILHLSDGKDFSQVNQVPSTLPAINNLIQKWDAQYERVSNTFDSVTGQTMPSRTPFRTTALLQQQGESMFTYRQEEFGIFMTEVMYDWILPFLIKRLNNGTYISGEFNEKELKLIDDSFVSTEMKKRIAKDLVEKATPVEAERVLALQQQIESIKPPTGRRFVEIPKDYFKDIRFKVVINTTGESVDKQAMFESLNNILVSVAQNPQIMTDPTLSKLFDKIIEMSNIDISPGELKASLTQSQNAQTGNPNANNPLSNAAASGQGTPDLSQPGPQGPSLAPNQ